MSDKTVPYIGNGAYCYANSAAMLLSSIGEKIPPSIIEVACGIGLSAFFMKKNNLLFFNFALPDEELARALKILGFECAERIIPKNQPAPIEQLKKDLASSPVVIGPIDMGYLTYNPDHKFLYGSDHYIFIYNFDGENFYLHDPEKFPFVILPREQLEKSWLSNKIFYGLENYRYWTSPKRIKTPTEKEIYSQIIEDFKSIYQNCDKKTAINDWTTGKEAILKSAERFKNQNFTQNEVGHFIYFALPVGAKRASDYAQFFKPFNKELSELKYEQAKIFGLAHSYAVYKNWSSFSQALVLFSGLEERFKNTLLDIK